MLNSHGLIKLPWGVPLFGSIILLPTFID